MGIEGRDQAAAPRYEEILREVAHTRRQGTPRQRYNADIWEPAVHAHSPDGPMIGDPCSQCGQPWPCRFLRNLFNSGLSAGRQSRS